MMENNKKDRFRSVFLVLVSAVLWGTYGSFVTRSGELDIGRNAFLFARFAVTALPVIPLLLRKDPGALKINLRDLPLFFLNGIGSIVFFTTCYTLAIRRTKIATAAALLYTAPAIVLVLSVLLFGEKLTKKKAICVLLSVVGCALVSGAAGGDLGLTKEGILLGLGAGLGYALYSIFTRYILNKGYAVFTNLLYTFGIAALTYLVLGMQDGGIQALFADPSALLFSVVCGFLTGFLAYLFYTEGLKGLESSRAAQIATIEPVTAAVLGMLLFHQTLSFGELCGIVLVLGSVVMMS